MYSLATGRGDVRSRLKTAYMGFWVLTEDHFPEEFRDDWKWIKNQLTKFGPLYDNSGERLISYPVEHTLSRIKNKTGQKIAEKIFYIGWALCTYDEYQ
ncbi:MAG: hypothetical protein ACE5FY_06830 [Nitrospiria bacterium]